MGVALRIPSATEGLPATRNALAYASTVHAGQSREIDGAPFIEHPREVAELLYGAGAPDHLIAAGALHEVIEKTPATAFDLRRRFGSEIAHLVLAVSEDGRIPRYGRRKAALRRQVALAGEEASLLFAADKISKARELRLKRPSLSPRAIRNRQRRLDHYRRSLSFLREQLPGSSLVDQLAAELSVLSRWPFAQPRR